ncbi:MAG: phytanoyl-CoA dioxygenase family protein [Acidobacteriota bacterium]
MNSLPARDTPAADYRRRGFHLETRDLLDSELVRRAVAGMERIEAGEHRTGRPPEASPWNPGDPRDRLIKIEMPHAADPDLRALVAHPALGRRVAELTGARRVQVFWVQHLAKPPASAASGPTRVGWHRDESYWTGSWEPDSELLTAWIACTDVEETRGPLTFVEGSHHWEGDLAGDFFSQDELRPRLGEGREWSEVAALLPAGGYSVHHCRTLHGSRENRSDRWRRSLALHLCTDRSTPRGGRPTDLSRYLDDAELCPVIHDADARP